MIPTFVIDSTSAPTELCFLGAKCNTDKSPYNTVGHRHPYTGLYNVLLAPYKHRPIHFGELGVAAGASVHLWRNFFESARLDFFDRDESFLNNSRSFGYPNTFFHSADVNHRSSINAALSECGDLFDVLLDDSSHNVEDQHNIVAEAMKFIKPGGMLLIEDVFRNDPDSVYLTMLEPVKDEISFFCFFLTEHKNKFSGDWNNDKVLMVVKK